MRPLFVALAVAAANLGSAQTVHPDVLNAMKRFADSPTLRMRFSGTETLNGRGKSFRVETSFLHTSTSGGDMVGLAEVYEEQNGVPISRTVADGQNLWAYQYAKNEYMAISYGMVGNDPSNYYGRLSDGLNARVESYGTYPVRFLRDILHRRDALGSMGATFRSWVPGFTPREIRNGSPAVTDPVNPNRRYLADPTRYFVLYTNGDAPTKSLAFEFVDDGVSYNLTHAYYSESSAIGTRSRLVDWQCEFQTSGLTFSSDTFRFVPPSNAKAVPPTKVDG